MGYTANPGDMCILIGEDNAVHFLPVLSSQGKYIMIAAKDLGDLTDKKFIYEIFTPYKVEGQDFYYEVGQLYPVAEAGTPDRKYSTLEGSFLPDAYVLPRRNGLETSYMAYAMSPNDLFWKRWDNHFGRVNVITELGRRTKEGNISFSDVFVPGTAINGLSAFHALNEENLPVEMGPLRKLISTSKVQGEGNVLLAICETQTASIYIGEAEILDQSGNVNLVKSDKVIGQVNVLRGGHGTMHPESVKELNGQVFWYSQNSRAFIRYASNGLFEISDYKWRRPTYALSKQIEALTAGGSIVMINGGIDPYFKEYLVQKKVYNSQEVAICPVPLNITITPDPTEDNPERVIASWEHAAENTQFYWKIMDSQGFEWASNPAFVSAGSPASVTIDGLNIGESYTFMVLTKCGGSNLSVWGEAAIYIDGADAPPEEGHGCVQASFADELPEVLPDAVVGEEYTYIINLGGSSPFTLTGIAGHAWAKINLVGTTVVIYGRPRVEDAGVTLAEQFTINNCAGTPLNFSIPLTVNLP